MAAPLREAGQVVIHIRPGMRGDRRRRTEPYWMNGPRLHIRCFGSLRLESEAGNVGGEWTQQRAGQVLAYLLCERHRSVRPEEIAEALWPDRPGPVLSTVRYFVHALRDHLEPRRAKRQPSRFILFSSGGYAINRELVKIDADEFEREARAGLRSPDPAEAERRLTVALGLSSGDFLADYPYAEWARFERDRLHALASDAVRALLEIRRARGEASSTLALAARLAEMEPLDETVHRELIAHHLRNDRPSEALRRYRALGERMHQQLGRAPRFSIAELSEACRPAGDGS
jgi:DNA-binding SARP family transcriptional activator